MRLRLMMGALACLVAGSADSLSARAETVAGSLWRSGACGLTILLADDGSATLAWSSAKHAADWTRDGDTLAVETTDGSHTFNGAFAGADRIEGVLGWIDVAGMAGEKSCVLSRQTA